MAPEQVEQPSSEVAFCWEGWWHSAARLGVEVADRVGPHSPSPAPAGHSPPHLATVTGWCPVG